jgi:hypothetical protein
VAHAYNPSYSGGRDQEDHGSKPTIGKQLVKPYLKETHHKKGWQSDRSSKSTSLASVRPCVQNLLLQKKKKDMLFHKHLQV